MRFFKSLVKSKTVPYTSEASCPHLATSTYPTIHSRVPYFEGASLPFTTTFNTNPGPAVIPTGASFLAG